MKRRRLVRPNERLKQLVSKVYTQGDNETMCDLANFLDANVRGMESEADKLRRGSARARR